MARSEINAAALNKSLQYNPDVVDALDKIGREIADDARIAAPKLTGAGAASISHEVVTDENGSAVRVSWDKKHWYMKFAELGTSHENPRPFLRPAAEKPRNI